MQIGDTMSGLSKADAELLSKIDEWFEAHREDILEDIKRIVRIPSISKPSASEMIAKDGPFGVECKRAMDEMLSIAREHGFETENKEYYVGTIGDRDKDFSNTIGFWNHLDVVPTGTGWMEDPFEPYIKDNFMIGRGVGDNKGPAIGMLYLMQCIRELGIDMKHQLCLFVGSDEERGMEDLEYYTANYETPKLSLIADSGFPVCYGEKGIIEGQFLAEKGFEAPVKNLCGGSASNMIPDRAYAYLESDDSLFEAVRSAASKNAAIAAEKTDDGIKITAVGTSRHSAFPEGSVNAVYELAVFLAGVKELGEENIRLFNELAAVSSEYYGKTEEVDYEDEVSGKTTCAATVLSTENGAMCINLNIRYAITQDSIELAAGLDAYAKKHGLKWRPERDSKPNYFPKEHPAVDFLTNLYNEWQGTDTKAFVMGGGTYARKLPHAFAYGIGGMPRTEEDLENEKKLFAPGHGGAHEPDEGLNLRMYFDAIKFYTLAVIRLDKLDY